MSTNDPGSPGEGEEDAVLSLSLISRWTPAALDLPQTRGITVFGADLWASNWEQMNPAPRLKLLTERLPAARKEMILLHESKAQTAAMLPAFLRYM